MLDATSPCPMAQEEHERIFASEYVKNLNKKNQVWTMCLGIEILNEILK